MTKIVLVSKKLLSFKKLFIDHMIVNYQFWKGNHDAQPVKLNLNKKLDPKQQTIKAFNIDA